MNTVKVLMSLTMLQFWGFHLLSMYVEDVVTISDFNKRNSIPGA